MKLTAKEIEAHRPIDGKDTILFADDFPGFGIRYRGNKTSWIYQWSTGAGPTRRTGRLKLGLYPAISPAKAREVAEKLHAKVTLGHDPAAEKRQRVAESEHTFGVLVTDHLAAMKDKVKPKSHGDLVRYLNRYAASLHKHPINKVDRRTVAKLLDDVAADHGKIAMNRCRSALSNLFVWAMKKGRAEANPIIGTEVAEETRRDRWLSDDELRSVWNALGSDDYGDIVRLLILTGQRRGEVADLKWSEVDFQNGLIVLPSERTKNGLRHEIPMSQPVREILVARQNTGERVFAPVVSWHRSREAISKKAGFSDWTLHDLRRTVSTGMGELGVAPHAIEATLNHISGFRAGVSGTYNRSSYAREKAQALDLWTDHVQAVVEGRKSKVVTLSGRVS
jgi:integrase